MYPWCRHKDMVVRKSFQSYPAGAAQASKNVNYVERRILDTMSDSTTKHPASCPNFSPTAQGWTWVAPQHRAERISQATHTTSHPTSRYYLLNNF